MQIEVGTVVEGKVTGITKFGAFVALPDGKSGLIHISEVANTYVNDIHDFLTDGQSVQVRVLSISPEGKISLSAKKAQEQPVSNERTAYKRPSAKPDAAPSRRPAAAEAYVPAQSKDQNFEDKLKQFMQESDSKMSGNKLYEQQRKSRARRK